MTQHRLSNSELELIVNTRGAELCSVRSRADGLEYIWQADHSVWARHAPHLFPIVGKLRNDRYLYAGHDYTLPQHGFARDREFVCIAASADHLCFELAASDDSLIAYPFHFSLKISYTLSGNVLTVAYEVFNPASDDLYMSLGAHPAFNCPLQDHETFEDYELQFDGMNQLDVSKLANGLIAADTKVLHLSDHKLHLTGSLFEKDALVMRESQVNQVRLSSTRTGRGVEMTCEGWPYFGIWTKPGSSRFLCLEPWYGIADSVQASGNLEDKEGIIRIASEQHFRCAYTTQFL